MQDQVVTQGFCLWWRLTLKYSSYAPQAYFEESVRRSVNQPSEKPLMSNRIRCDTVQSGNFKNPVMLSPSYGSVGPGDQNRRYDVKQPGRLSIETHVPQFADDFPVSNTRYFRRSGGCGLVHGRPVHILRLLFLLAPKVLIFSFT
jgi:hypothetical protein